MYSRSFLKAIPLWQKHWQKLVLAVIITGLVGFIQLLYWKVYSGSFLFYTYRDYGFSWMGQHLLNCFFSYKKGWLVYTPVMVFALIGFYFLFKQKRTLFWWSFIFFLINTYIVFSWDIWWYGGSFGQRAMVQSYVILAFPLAAFCESVLKTNWKYAVIPIFLFCGWLNIHQMYQSHAPNGGMDPEFMTEAYYWRIFGRTNIPDRDRILMDTDEDFAGNRKDVQTIFEEDFENYKDATIVWAPISRSGKQAVFVNFDHNYSPAVIVPVEKLKTDWVRANAWFYAPWKEWDMWRMTQFHIAFLQDDQVVKERFIRLHRFLPTEKWTEGWIDLKVPDAPFNKIKVWLDNAQGQVHLYGDDFKIETFNE